MTLNLVTFNRREPIIHWMEYHAKHTQTFIPLSGKPFIMVLGKPTRMRPDQTLDESQPELPDLANVRAFYFDGSCGVCMHVGTWHEVPFPMQDDTHFVAVVTNETNRNLEEYDKHYLRGQRRRPAEAQPAAPLRQAAADRPRDPARGAGAGVGRHPGRGRARLIAPPGRHEMRDKVILTCAVTGAGDTRRQAPRRAGDARPGGGRLRRGREGRRRHRARSCPRPEERAGRARPGAVPRGGRAGARLRHRHRAEPHRRHGRQPAARPRRSVADDRRHRPRDRRPSACATWKSCCPRCARSTAAA